MKFFKIKNKTEIAHDENDIILKKLQSKFSESVDSVNLPANLEINEILKKPVKNRFYGFAGRQRLVSAVICTVILIIVVLGYEKTKLPDNSIYSKIISSSVSLSEESLPEESIVESIVNNSSQEEINPPVIQNTRPKPGARLDAVYAEDYTAVYNEILKFKPTGERPKPSDFEDGDQPMGGASGGAKLSLTENNNYGKTNNQVSDVEEADLIKNDGKYIYTLSKLGLETSVRIIQASSDGNMNIVSKINMSGNNFSPDEIYVFHDKLVVIGNVNKYQGNDINSCGSIEYGGIDSCILIYDIKDRSNPVQARSFSQQGRYIDSRMINNELYIISNYYIHDLYDFSFENMMEYIPHTIDSKNGKKVMPANNIAVHGKINSASFILVSRIDVENDSSEILTESVMQSGDNIYASSSGIYIASASHEEQKQSINLMRFYIGDGVLQCEATGKVDGWILNQFSMDEFDNHFRIVSTERKNWMVTMSTSIYILNRDLKITGSVKDIAPGEAVMSVRFINDMGYVVTFLQVDPLFAIDLSNPSNPEIIGQLKIPGFSSYMHPISENLIIGIGQENSQMKFSLFDVSDAKNPKEIHKYIYEDSEISYSSVGYDHKAVTYDSKRNILAVPYSADYYNYDNNDLYFSIKGLIVFSVNKNTGFNKLALITHHTPRINSAKGYTHELQRSYSDEILRSSYIDDAFFTISNNMIMSIDLKTFKRKNQISFIDESSVKCSVFAFDCAGFVTPEKKDYLLW